MVCKRLLVLLASLGLGLAAACETRGSSGGGLPPASQWTPPEPAGSRAGGAPGARMDPSNPHAGMDMSNPHAGMDMSNPHAGMDMSDPHAGLDMSDPHAGLDMSDPHDGLDTGGGHTDDHPPMDPMTGLEPPDPDRPIDASKFLRGTLRATAEVEKLIEPGAILFLTAWPVDPTTQELLGAPLAAEKIDVTSLPIEFRLDEHDTMVKGTRFEGDVLITARIDGDGEARTKEPGDVEGRLVARIPGDKLQVVLDTVLR